MVITAITTMEKSALVTQQEGPEHKGTGGEGSEVSQDDETTYAEI